MKWRHEITVSDFENKNEQIWIFLHYVVSYFQTTYLETKEISTKNPYYMFGRFQFVIAGDLFCDRKIGF